MELNYAQSQILSQAQACVTDLEPQDLAEIFYEFRKGKAEKKITLEAFLKYLRIEFGVETKKQEKKRASYSMGSLPKNLLGSNFAPTKEIIVAQNLHKQVGPHIPLLTNLNFSIHAITQIAIVGPNGAGKSTLLKVLAKKDDQFDGDIIWASGLKIGFLSQDLILSKNQSSLQDYMKQTLPHISTLMQELQDIHDFCATNTHVEPTLYDRQTQIMEELTKLDGYKKFALQTDILKYFGFSEDQFTLPVSALSGGEMMRIQIAQFILQEVDILVLDEPTNHLDIEGIVFLEEFLKKWKKAVICVSHDKKFINSLFKAVWEINNGNITPYYGNYDFYEAEREKRYDKDLKIYEQQQEYIREQEDWIKRNAGTPTKSGMVESKKKMLARIPKVEKPILQKTVGNISLERKEHLPGLFFETENLSIGYPNGICVEIGDLSIFKGRSFGIVGKNGSGKTTFLKTLMGELAPLRGETYVNPSIQIGYFSQISDTLNPEKSALEEIERHAQESEKTIRGLLGCLLLSGDKPFDKIKTLSGGERSKVALAILILQKPQLLLLDEPTNHLDIQSKDMMKNMLAHFSGVSVIVSHDRDFLEGIVEEILLIKDGQGKMYDNLNEAFGNILGEE